MKSAAELEKLFEVTAEEIDKWASDAENGIYPGAPKGEIIVGRPLLFGQALKPVTFKETEAKIAAIDKRAKSLQMSRSDYLRHLVDQDLSSIA